MKFKQFYLEETTLIKGIRKIAEMKTDKMQKVGDYDMDVKTAKAIMDAYDVLPKDKKKAMASMPLGRLTDVAWQTKGFQENINEGTMSSKSDPKIYADLQKEAKRIANGLTKEVTTSVNSVMKKHGLDDNPQNSKFVTTDQGPLAIDRAIGAMVANYLVPTQKYNIKFK